MKKNPLNNRFLRDLRDDLGKYVVIALLMIFTIGFVSGFLVEIRRRTGPLFV